MSNLKERLKNGDAVYGTMLSVFDTPDIVRILKNNGIEWFFFDSEHGYPNIDRLYGIFGYARLVGLTGLLRIPEINKTEVFRAMDMGVDGIVCPNVETAEMAKELVQLAKYAPMGERGVSMTRPHTEFKSVKALEYMDNVNRNTLIVCQTESVKGLENLESILQVDGVDGILIGPNDLSQSMGIFNQMENPNFLAAVDRILATCKKHNKFAGMPNKSMKALKTWESKGFQLMQWGSDVSIFANAVKAELGC